MKDFFKEVFSYHHHFNQLLAGQITEHRAAFTDDTYKLFCHVLNAHQVWNARIQGTTQLKVWQELAPELLKQIDADNYANALQIIDQVPLGKVVSYTTSAGQPFTNTVQDILFHVNNHTTYHRGQLAMRVKAAGLTPLVSDFIFYKR